MSFFLRGALGDINPYFAVTPLEQDASGEEAQLDWRSAWGKGAPDPASRSRLSRSAYVGPVTSSAPRY